MADSVFTYLLVSIDSFAAEIDLTFDLRTSTSASGPSACFYPVFRHASSSTEPRVCLTRTNLIHNQSLLILKGQPSLPTSQPPGVVKYPGRRLEQYPEGVSGIQQSPAGLSANPGTLLPRHPLTLPGLDTLRSFGDPRPGLLSGTAQATAHRENIDYSSSAPIRVFSAFSAVPPYAVALHPARICHIISFTWRIAPS
jgi:hypothetical protein